MDIDKKLTVLVVDDDPNLREIMKAKLESAGFNVCEAVDGQECLEEVKKSRPDLVLMDVQMPKMNGVEALSKIKGDPDLADTKVLFLTNYGEPNTADAPLDDKFAKEVGALGHLRKTDDLNVIVDRIKKELAV